jgi:hypothetical protein
MKVKIDKWKEYYLRKGQEVGYHPPGATKTQYGIIDEVGEKTVIVDFYGDLKAVEKDYCNAIFHRKPTTN